MKLRRRIFRNDREIATQELDPESVACEVGLCGGYFEAVGTQPELTRAR